MALTSSSKGVLTWIVTPAACIVGGGMIGHSLKSDYGWKAGAGIGLVVGLLAAVGIDAATAGNGTGLLGAPKNVKTKVIAKTVGNGAAPASNPIMTAKINTNPFQATAATTALARVNG